MSEKSSSESEQNKIDEKQTSSSIWTTKELSILQSYIEAYKQEPITKKQKLVQKQVVPQIKAAYRDRYKESSLRADKEINEEWKKKKWVQMTRNEIPIVMTVSSRSSTGFQIMHELKGEWIFRE